MTLISFHNDETIKEKYLTRLKKHHELDQIIQGITWESDTGRGCAVSCTLEKYNHKAYEDELGIPEWLGRLQDRIFEGLPKNKSADFALDFLISIPVGVNLEPVKYRFCAFILRENINRVLTLNITDELKKEVVHAVRGVLVLHEEAIKTGKWSARSARSAAESAEWSAWSAEWSAEWSAYERYADYLLKLLKEAK